ncbi:MAG TPA: hypothetical protein VJ773_11050 [Gemmatimonadales bacterium]|nr:hypothetical protein [Gemmatimonadales bacterium]
MRRYFLVVAFLLFLAQVVQAQAPRPPREGRPVPGQAPTLPAVQ